MSVSFTKKIPMPILLFPPPLPFPATTLAPPRRLRRPSRRWSLALRRAARSEADAFTEKSGYLFEVSVAEAESLGEYDAAKIAAIFRRRPLLVARRLFQIAATFGKWLALRYADGLADRSDQMFQVSPVSSISRFGDWEFAFLSRNCTVLWNEHIEFPVPVAQYWWRR